MFFETKEKELLARIGKLKTNSGTVETPLLFPVVNPFKQVVSPCRLRKEFGFEAVMTNAYILKKNAGAKLGKDCLHSFLGFDGPVMTDSGAYQILIYGEVDFTPREIVEYQEYIGSDIATILDIPTGWRVTEKRAKQTVDETVKRAKQFHSYRIREDILWVGPVQGGKYLELVAESAKEMGKLPFQIHALGSPTEVMERYRLDVLVDMIMTAKMNLPLERPLHLFGAGHPFMFALAVALGCDFFDSAAYALYAKENRYMTETGTFRLDELDYFPCTCPKCAKSAPQMVSELPEKERETFLAEHNLHVCAGELRRIKQSIKDGRLWEHLEMRAHGHPALLQALKRLKSYQDFIEKNAPATKSRGIFYFDSTGLMRPEILSHRRKMAERYTPPKNSGILLLIPQTRMKPFHKSATFRELVGKLPERLRNCEKLHICFYAAPFGVVPMELDEVYPLSQYEIVLPLDRETVEYVAEQLRNYIIATSYKEVILVEDKTAWNKTVLKTCRTACAKKNIKFQSINLHSARATRFNDWKKGLA